MNDADKDASRALEWSLRFGIPMLAWAAVFVFFAFAGSVSPHEPVMAVGGGAAAPLGADRMTTRSGLGHEQPRIGELKKGEPALVNSDPHEQVNAGHHATR